MTVDWHRPPRSRHRWHLDHPNRPATTLCGSWRISDDWIVRTIDPAAIAEPACRTCARKWMDSRVREALGA